VIYPTHSCFDDAIMFCLHLEAHELADFRVVHALCLSDGQPEPDRPYAHAWVEQRDADGRGGIWQAGIVDGRQIYYAVRHDEFYATHRVVRSTVYTCELAAELTRQHDFTGPWRAEYRAATANGDARVWRGARMHPYAFGCFDDVHGLQAAMRAVSADGGGAK
jgi:hypothetical protein